ncbi:MAG TPA: transcription termination/antitermination protein NusG [Firmicutes bacterium]|nr:transcription termination/antitermination protein NusG [Bacillota bacterium]HHY98688.1 transcription termination/antitermination protein NusG [Bacillota bacterium]
MDEDKIEVQTPPEEGPQPTTEVAGRSPKRWYVIHTYSGYENKVKANLEKRVKTMEKEDKIFRVLVPTQEEYEIKDGKRKISKRKVFPGYVLVEMIMEDDSWYVVRNTPGVTGFVGSGNKPIPLQDKEARLILKQMGIEEPRPKMDFSIGEQVRVVAGPFQHFTGAIEEIQKDKGKLRVLVSMFGRETPVELDFSQVEKI